MYNLKGIVNKILIEKKQWRTYNIYVAICLFFRQLLYLYDYPWKGIIFAEKNQNN